MTNISELGELSCRVENALKNDCIETIEQIQKLSDEYLMKLPNFGRKSLAELRQAVENWEGRRLFGQWVPVVLPHPRSDFVVGSKLRRHEASIKKGLETRQRKAEEMVRRWRAGEHYINIARDMGIYSSQTVANTIHRYLYPPHQPTLEEITARIAEKEKMVARRLKIYEMHKAGKSYKEVGDELGISRERARQIYERYLRKHDLPAWRELEKLRRERQIALYESPKRVAQREKDRAEWERRNKTHLIMVRYFDREESAEDLAREAGWTMDEMNARIKEYRDQQWVTMTEYNQKMGERRHMWEKLLNDRT